MLLGCVCISPSLNILDVGGAGSTGVQAPSWFLLCHPKGVAPVFMGALATTCQSGTRAQSEGVMPPPPLCDMPESWDLLLPLPSLAIPSSIKNLGMDSF